MTGLLWKAWSEGRIPTLLFSLALFVITLFLTFLLPQITDEITAIWMQMPFVRTMVGALLGFEIEEGMPAGAFNAIVWVHPTVLAIVWAHEIIACTRMPAGEIDRGTIDILLAMPVTRRAVYVAESIVWLATGIVLITGGLLGHLVGLAIIGEPVGQGLARAVRVTANLIMIYVAVGGIALLVSALSSRRGRAIGIVFAIVLASFLLNFLAQFWPPAERVAWLSILEYYRPAFILRGEGLPVRDLAVLLGVGVVTWTAGLEWMVRWNIATT